MSDRFHRKFDVQTSYKPYAFGLIFVANIKFPRATYHTVVPSTEELCCLNIMRLEKKRDKKRTKISMDCSNRKVSIGNCMIFLMI